jgi:anti-sigma factor RsiW
LSANETGTGGACEQMLLRMSRALDGDLADHEIAELSAHLAGCAPCRARLIEMNAADNLFRKLEKKRSVPSAREAAFVQKVMEQVRLEAASVGGVREFSRLVEQDPDLQDQLRPAASPDTFVELFVSLGRQRGYRFGSGEVVSLLAARRAANDDLSDEQLDAVVGGVSQAGAGSYAFLDDVLQNWFK